MGNKKLGKIKIGINKAQKIVDSDKYRWYKVHRGT